MFTKRKFEKVLNIYNYIKYLLFITTIIYHIPTIINARQDKLNDRHQLQT